MQNRLTTRRPNRTFVCDNLAFSSEIVINKQHTRFDSDQFQEGIACEIRVLNYYP